MQRFILSAFSTLLVTVAVAPTTQALPAIDADFNLQTLRLSEFDARNKSDEVAEQPYYYPQTSTQPSAQTVSEEESSIRTTEPTEWERSATGEASATQEEPASPEPSLIDQRHQSLDRS